jgi:hypothetical protein
MDAPVTQYIQGITSEHADKPNFTSMVTTTVQPFANSAALYASIPILYDLDNAVGVELDTLGQWVGVTRYLSSPITGVYFAFDTSGLGFDRGVWMGPFDPSTGLVRLPDEYYKLVILARILNNNWDGSKTQAYVMADIIFLPFGFTYYIDDHADLSISIGILGPTPPPALLTALLNSGKLDLKPATIHVASRVAQQGPIFSFDLNVLLFQGFDTSVWALSV